MFALQSNNGSLRLIRVSYRALSDERLQVHVNHLRCHSLLVVPQGAERRVSRLACLDALYDVTLAHLACPRDELRRAWDPQSTVFAERLVEDFCRGRCGGRVMLYEEPYKVIDILKGLVRALSKVWACGVRSISNEDDPAFVPCLQFGTVVEAILHMTTHERLHTS